MQSSSLYDMILITPILALIYTLYLCFQLYKERSHRVEREKVPVESSTAANINKDTVNYLVSPNNKLTTPDDNIVKKKKLPILDDEAPHQKNDKEHFMVFAGVFINKDNANALVSKLMKLGFVKSEVVKLENSPNFHVTIGYYSSKSDAEADRDILITNKIDGYIKNYKPH